MTDQQASPVIDAQSDAEPERHFGVDEELVRACEVALIEGRYGDVGRLIEPLHASDLADMLEALSADARNRLVDQQTEQIDGEMLSHLDESVREDVLERLEPEQVAAALTELETDDAVDLFEDVPESDQQQVLDSLSPSDRAMFEEALTFPEDSAGRLMQRETVTVPDSWTVGDTIDYMRARAALLPRDFYDIFVVGGDRKPVGAVPLSRLMRNERPVRVADIMQSDLHPVPLTLDQEDVALMFRQYGMVSAPVVGETGELVGVITADDVVHVINEEAEEDIMRLGGVREDDFYEAIIDTTRSRFSWLLLNLFTAIVASVVIGFFDAAIEKVVALAILMPIVASMGGNAGTQTLTVAVRALAMKELTPANAVRIVGKEFIVGGINGMLFAILIGLIAWAWFGDGQIGGIIAAAMVINLLVAGFAGVAIPLVLDRAGIDPAVASGVVLTTVTDVVGFFAFLGLAALVLL